MWTIHPPKPGAKRFFVSGPNDAWVEFDYDDVDHDTVMTNAKQMVHDLNRVDRLQKLVDATVGVRPFERFMNLMRLRATTPWCQAQGLSDWARHTADEAAELEDAVVAVRPSTEIESEAGDVLGNLLCLIIRLEEKTQGRVNLDTIFKAAEAKLKHRHPWLLKPRSEWPNTAEEEHAEWEQIKKDRA